MDPVPEPYARPEVRGSCHVAGWSCSPRLCAKVATRQIRNGRMAYGRVLLPEKILGVDADRHKRVEMDLHPSIAVENDRPVHRDGISGAVISADKVPVDGSRHSLASPLRPIPYPTGAAAPKGAA